VSEFAEGAPAPPPCRTARADRLLGGLAVMGAASVWGVTFTLTEPALHHFSAMQVAFLRLVFALPVLAALQARARSPLPPLRLAVPFAATGLVGYFLLTNFGLQRASAGLGALLQGLGPAMTALLAAVVLGEALTLTVGLSVALAVAGAVVMGIGPGGPHSSPVGVLLLILASFAWASYTVLGRLHGGVLDAVQRSFLPAILAAIVLAPLALADAWHAAGVGPWLLIVGLGATGGGLAYPLWNFGVSRVSAGTAGVLGNVSPVVALAAAAGLLGDRVTAAQLAGGAMVITGAVVVSYQQARAPGGRPEPALEPE
jgi:drug/metabolite transporter (DMT)-like permease